MLAIALALLVAQVVSAVLLFRAGEQQRENNVLTAAAFQLASGAERAERRAAFQAERGTSDRRGPRGERGRNRDRARDRDGAMGRLGFLPFRLRYTVSSEPPFALAAEGEREAKLRELLSQQGIAPSRVAVETRLAGDDPLLVDFARDRPRFDAREDWRSRTLVLAAIQREDGARWETARVLVPQPPRRAIGVLLFQTLVTFVFLVGVLYFVLRRITRPLAALTARVDSFSREPERAVRLDETGPTDIRRLIAAHNGMEARVAALLDEKDVMLGAIGHDLKTPLAALRVRIESVPDETQRAKMAAGIEDITATLDDILSLARVGRDGASVEAVDLGALAEAVAEEFEELGEPVTVAEMPRLVARVQMTWIKRALRNLVSNAVRYGGSAAISASDDGTTAILRVEDDGPGIPAGLIADMLEPFTRGEASRNRATGGAGLGLTLARAIAEQHGGELVLKNRAEGGLRAELRLPLKS